MNRKLSEERHLKHLEPVRLPPGGICMLWMGRIKVQAILNSALALPFFWPLTFLHVNAGSCSARPCEQLGPSLASSTWIHGELIKAFQSFLITQISLVSFWLVCWFTACPNQDYKLRLARPLVLSVWQQDYYYYWHYFWAGVFSMLSSKSSQLPLAAKLLVYKICSTLVKLLHWPSLR